MLLRRRRAVALRVNSRRPQRLALAPLLDWRRDLVRVHPAEGAVVIAHPKASVHIAVSSSQPFRHDGTATQADLYAPIFRTLQPETEFTLYIAFGRDPESALAQAQRLRESDGVRQHKQGIFELLTRSHLWTSDGDYNRALAWARLTSYFMVVEEFGKGIWAGLPWFKDNWGRDTFISLPGALLVGGLFEDAKDVIRNFARWQNTDKASKDCGRIPNRVAGPGDIIYNTTDGTPWMIREIHELLQYTGDTRFAQEMFPAVRLALESAMKTYCDKQGLLTHDDADTWMDARIEGKTPWSPRGDRANDIQVLWFTALLAGARLAEMCGEKAFAKKCRDLAEKLRKNFQKLFWNRTKKIMADRVKADGDPDFKVRPNQLLLLSVPMDEPFLAPEIEERVLSSAVGELLFPHGLCSLSQNDPWFHPVHRNDERYHFDAAYHNGTIWGWNAGFATTALVRHGQTELAWQLAGNLARQMLDIGCRGSMSELLDAWPDKKGKIKPSGTWAQTWSTAEFARNGYQDFGGFRPRLLDGVIELSPRVPSAWSSFTASFPFGRDGYLMTAFTRQHGKEVWVIRMEGHTQPVELRLRAEGFGKVYRIETPIKAADTLALVLDGKTATLGVNGQWSAKPPKGEALPKIKPLSFAKPNTAGTPPCLKQKDYLRHHLDRGAASHRPAKKPRPPAGK
jgi:glycogen debranching enzyme